MLVTQTLSFVSVSVHCIHRARKAQALTRSSINTQNVRMCLYAWTRVLTGPHTSCLLDWSHREGYKDWWHSEIRGFHWGLSEGLSLILMGMALYTAKLMYMYVSLIRINLKWHTGLSLCYHGVCITVGGGYIYMCAIVNYPLVHLL